MLLAVPFMHCIENLQVLEKVIFCLFVSATKRNFCVPVMQYFTHTLVNIIFII